MENKIITSLNNSKIKEYTKLHQKKYRYLKKMFLVFDLEVIQTYQHLCLEIFSTYPLTNMKTQLVSKEVMTKLAKTDNKDIVAVMPFLTPKDIGTNENIIVLDQVADPLNIGMIIECMNFYGFKHLVYSDNCADIYDPKVLNEAKESFFKVNLIHQELLGFLNSYHQKGYQIYATALAQESIDLKSIKFHKPFILIFGSESHGISKEILNVSDYLVKIEMTNLDSLNVSVAAAISCLVFSK